jgi:hypothetical protein
MSNPHDTCTAASFTWARMMLTDATPRPIHFAPDDMRLRMMMDTVGIRTMDHNVRIQANLAQTIVTDTGSGSYTSQQIAEIFKANEPHVGIFWCSFHTVAYAYAHDDKRYFDNNIGLYRAKKTAHIIATMEHVRTTGGYGAWKGYAIVQPQRQRMLI